MESSKETPDAKAREDCEDSQERDLEMEPYLSGMVNFKSVSGLNFNKEELNESVRKMRRLLKEGEQHQDSDEGATASSQ